jgi:hypothetical protein
VALLQENEWKDAGLSQWLGGDELEKKKDATVGKDCGGRDYLQAGTSLLKDTNGSQRVKMTLLMPAGGGAVEVGLAFAEAGSASGQPEGRNSAPRKSLMQPRRRGCGDALAC